MTEKEMFKRWAAEKMYYGVLFLGAERGWLKRASQDRSVELALLVLTIDPPEQAAARQQAIELARQILKDAE